MIKNHVPLNIHIILKHLKKNDLERFSKDKKLVGCRWIYTVKQNLNISIDLYKARL